MTKLARRVTRWFVLAIALLICAPTVAAAGCRSAVLPADARPYGYSLRDMTKALASFSTSGNNMDYYPKTPIQILYADFSKQKVDYDGTGYHFSGTNSFSVGKGRYFYVPLWNVTNSPIVVGTYPTTHEQAVRYFFKPTQIGGRDFSITVDGKQTPVGRSYLAGPVSGTLFDAPEGTEPGDKIMTLGAFLRPLSPGTHTVRIQGGLFGDLIQDAFPDQTVRFLSEDFTYTVEVEC